MLDLRQAPSQVSRPLSRLSRAALGMLLFSAGSGLAEPPGARAPDAPKPSALPARAQSKLSADPIVLCAASDEAWELTQGRWRRALPKLERARANSGLRINDGEHLFVLLEPKERWGYYRRPTGALQLLKGVAGGAEIAGLRRLSSGQLFSARSHFHGVQLHRDRRTLVKTKGAKAPRVRKDGAFLYAVQPKMGAKEAPYYTDLIEGSTMALYFSSPGLKPKKVVEAPVIANARFLGPSHAVYWRSGQVRKQDNYKTWDLERVELKTGRRRRLLTWEGPLRRDGRWHRSAPKLRTFERSSWLLTTDRFREKSQYIAVHALSGVARALTLPAGFTMVRPMPGYEPHALVLAKSGAQLSIWNVVKQREIGRIDAPVGCQVASATFMNRR